MGAGIAGISAAIELYKHNITNIIVIEAQNYIGGRMKTIDFNGYKLNGGASWIHGACVDCKRSTFKTNPILKLAHKYNIKYRVDNTNSFQFHNQYHAHINWLKLGITSRKYQKANECVQKKYYETKKYYKTNKKIVSYRKALTQCGWKTPNNKYSKFAEYINFDLSDFAADKNNAFSNLESAYDIYGDQDLFVTDPSGFAGIVTNLGDELISDGVEIKLNEAIESIRYNDTLITVKTGNDNIYRAKYGIITFSIGALQSDVVSYVPSLPSWKLSAINKRKIGDYMAIYIKWPYDFWTKNIFKTFGPKNGKEQLIFLDDRKGYFIWAKNLNAKHYFEKSNIWRIDVVDEMAKRLQLQSIEEIMNEYINKKLKKYFKKIPKPLDIAISNWTNNIYIKGAYSYWNKEFTLNDWKNLKKKVDNLYFCGEATSFMEYGYVSGAYLEGISTAHKITKLLNESIVHKNEDGKAVNSYSGLQLMWIAVVHINICIFAY